MSTYLRVKENTDAWTRFNDVWTWEDKWVENQKELEAFLGFDYEKNLYLDCETLTIDPRVLPDEWNEQFKKNSHPAVAKKTSKINKEWVELCEKLQLKVYNSTRHISFPLDVYGKIETLYPPMDGVFYCKQKNGKPVDWKIYDWIEEVNEVDFLRIRADWLEKTEKEKVVV